jgi:hypothetical protein
VGENTHIGSDAPIVAMIDAPRFNRITGPNHLKETNLGPAFPGQPGLARHLLYRPVSSGRSMARVGESTQVGFLQLPYTNRSVQ